MSCASSMAASTRAFSSLTRWPTSRLAGAGRGLQPGVVDLRQDAVLARQPAVAKVFPVGLGVQTRRLGVERGEQVADRAIQRLGRVIFEFGNGVHGLLVEAAADDSFVPPLKGLGFKLHVYPALKPWANSFVPLRGTWFMQIRFTQQTGIHEDN